jgi:hypothetical protein
MRPTELSTRVLYGMAAALLLLGLALRIAPAPAGAISAAGVTHAAPVGVRPDMPGELPQAAATVVEGNLFSASRAAPRVRFTPPDLDPPATARRPQRGPGGARLRLFGTVVGPSGTAALIDADPTVRGAEIYQVGDMVSGKQVVAVSESTVVLTGAGGSGRVVLRLQAAPSPAR